MKKKVLGILLSLSMVSVMLAGCTSAADQAASSGSSSAEESSSEASSEASSKDESSESSEASTGDKLSVEDLKVGFVYVGDETDQGYTANFMSGTKELKETLGLSDDQVIEKVNIPETSECETALRELAEAGCNIIFATSFGFEDFVEEVAPDYPDIQFCHATGYQSANDDLDNTHNYFPQIYEARYLTGIVAGLKTKTNKLGYVAAFAFSEPMSGYTAFYLGAKSVNPDVTMEVKYTNSWNDPTQEAQLAQALIDDGCDVIGQHADSTATATTCEANGVWSIGYNSDMISRAPKASLTSCRCDWGAYAIYACQALLDGEEIAQDWTGGLNEGAVIVCPFNDDIMPEGAAEAVEKAEKAIKSGELHVFDTSTFTVGGEEMTTYTNDYGVEFIKDGYFHEQDPEYGGSSPAWPTDWVIDGITAE